MIPSKPGFPLLIAESPVNEVAPVGSQVIAADLGLSPGFKSIIFGLRNRDLYVIFRNAGGNWVPAPGWPQQLPGHVFSSPAIGDLNGDGQPEIVVGYGSTFTQSSQHGGFRAYRTNGTVLWEVLTNDGTGGPGGPNGFRDPVVATPAIGDINGDGQVDVVVGGLDHRMFVVNGATGASINGAVWPKDMTDTVFSSAALYDFDADGRLDIIVGTDYSLTPGGLVRVLRFDGTDLPGFPKLIDQVVGSSPAVGDIDGDGRPDIVHGTGIFWNDANNGALPEPLHRLYAYHANGAAIAGWPVATLGPVTTSPVLANIDADPALEVIATTFLHDPTPGSPGSGDEGYRLYAFNGNGSQVFPPIIVRGFQNESLSATEPQVADIMGGTSAPEILVPTNGEIAVFTATGSRLTETDGFPDDGTTPNFETQDTVTGVAVTDLETDGAGSRIEVITVSGQPFPDQNTTVVHVWNPVDRATTPLWGFFRNDEKRRGVVPKPCVPLPVGNTLQFFTLTPCRLLDTRDPNGPFGGPALLSGSQRDFVLAGRCGIPASARALSINMTVVAPQAGAVSLAPGCVLPPNFGTIGFNNGNTRANNQVLLLGPGGVLTAAARVPGPGSVHLLVDVNGYFQ